MEMDSLVMARLLALRKITEQDAPYTRRAFTPMYQKGRALIIEWLAEIGVAHWFDTAGNLHARIEGKSASTIYFGSHSDTVPKGGAYDGILGVVTGIELLAYIKHHQIPLNYSLEFIDFLAEETTDWGLSCIGSRALVGQLTDKDLNLPHPQTGELLKDAINRAGGDLRQGLPKLALTDQDYFIELHIEQGPVLEKLGLDIGIVNSIVGITRLKLDVRGLSNHSGTTPMTMRQDSLIASSQLIMRAHQISLNIAQKAEDENHYFVMTVGKINNYPNAINVVPGQTVLFFDLRTTDNKYVFEFEQLLKHEVEKLMAETKEDNLPITGELSILSQTKPAFFDEKLVEKSEQIAKEKGLTYRVMTSGAGHDAAFMVQKMKAMMIFIPSEKGISHNVLEHSSVEDIQQGVEFFRDLILALNQSADNLEKQK